MRHGARPAEDIRLPSSLLKELADFPSNEFDRVLDEVRKADDLRLPKAVLERLRTELGSNGRTAAVLLAFTSNVFDHLCDSSEFGIEKKEFLEVFQEILRGEFDDEHQAQLVFNRLEQLLQPWRSALRRRKKEWLETGILPTAIDFASFVDLRPDFSDDRMTIDALVPIAIVEIVTQSSPDERKSIQFQLGAKALADLKALVADIEKKLKAAEAIKVKEGSNG
jgi:hypothetical protein